MKNCVKMLLKWLRIIIIIIVQKFILIISAISFIKFIENLIKWLFYPLLWIVLRLTKNQVVQSQLYFWLFLNPQIVLWMYLVLIRLFFLLLINFDLSIVDIGYNSNVDNENTNEFFALFKRTCAQQGVPLVSENSSDSKALSNVTLFSVSEESDFWVQKQKYTMHKAYKNYLSSENSRNRFYNRTFNNSFDDSIWAERSFSKFMSYTFSTRELNMGARNPAWAEHFRIQGQLQEVLEKELLKLSTNIDAMTKDFEKNPLDMNTSATLFSPRVQRFLQTIDLYSYKLKEANFSLEKLNPEAHQVLLNLVSLEKYVLANAARLSPAEAVGQVMESLQVQEAQVQEVTNPKLHETLPNLKALNFRVGWLAAMQQNSVDFPEGDASKYLFDELKLILLSEYSDIPLDKLVFSPESAESCFYNKLLIKKLTLKFDYINWTSEPTWNLIFEKFKQNLGVKSSSSSEVHQSQAVGPQGLVDNRDIGSNSRFDSDSDEELKRAEKVIQDQAAKEKFDLELDEKAPTHYPRY